MDTYCYKLNLPNNTALSVDRWAQEQNLNPIDLSKNFYKRFDVNLHISQSFLDWLDSLGLFYSLGGYFYVPQNGKVLPHVDGQELLDFCKINFRTGGPGSVIRWYKDVPKSKLIHAALFPGSVNLKDNYCYVRSEDLTEISSMEHPEFCIHNAGKIHSFDAGSSPQHIVSIIVGSKDTHKKLTWDQAKEVFKDYIGN
jgi:hypothetical protein